MSTATTTMIRFGHPHDSTLPRILLLWLYHLFAIFCIIIAVPSSSSSSSLSSIVSTTFAFELMPTTITTTMTTTTTTIPCIIESRRKIALQQQRQQQNWDKSSLKFRTSLNLKNDDDDDDQSDDQSNRNSQKLIIQQQKQQQQQQQDNVVDSKEKKELLVDKFVSYLLDALKSESFVSLALFGINNNNNSNNNNRISKEDLRGSIRQVQGRHIQVKNTDLLQLTIKYHGATDICKNLRFDELQSTMPQILLNPRKSAALLAVSSEWGIESMVKNPICRAELITTTNVWELQLSNSNCNNHQASSSSSSLKKRRHKKKLSTQSTTSTSHDRTKNVPISTKSDFLFNLGVTKADGKPKPGMKSKLRQCQKFVEIVGNLVEKAVIAVDDDDKKRQQQQSTTTSSISVVDMGCGRGYLTFALHQYLSDKYSNNKNNHQVKEVYSKGIDVRPKLVAEISKISNSLGGSFQTLTFEQGTIEDIVQEAGLNSAAKSASSSSFEDIGKEDSSDDASSSSSSLLQVLIALHACDTATDDALWSGICRSVDIIVVAPCCHKQVRPQIDQLYITASKKQKSKQQQQHPLVDILKHGIYRERFAETVTDSLRALLLELAGYKVQVFEFIGGEHTSKNVMITAIKNNNNNQKNNNGNDDDTTTTKATIRQRIHTLCGFHGIQNQKLADWMGLDLMKMISVDDDDDDDQEEWMTSTNRRTNAKKSARLVQLQMPAPRGQ